MPKSVAYLANRLFRRRDFELWQSYGRGQTLFMVASRLTRQEAIDAATLLATSWPRPLVVVLDREGSPVYRLCQSVA